MHNAIPNRTQKTFRSYALHLLSWVGIFGISSTAIAATTEAIKPQLAIPIPGVSLSKVIVGEGSMSVNWIAEYVVGVYTYLFGAVGFLVAFMMMFGGFQILTAGGDASKVSKGKAKIKNAVIGTVIAASAYLILGIINSDLTTLQPLSVRTVRADPVNMDRVPTAPSSSSGSAQPEVAEAIIREAKAQGVDPCVALIIAQHESGMQVNRWSGDYMKLDKYAATSYGPCQINYSAWFGSNKSLSNFLKSKFPNFPTEGTGAEKKKQIVDVLTSDKNVAAAACAYIMKKHQVSTIYGLATYYSGGGPIDSYAKANSITINKSLLIKDFKGNGAAGMAAAGIPEVVTVRRGNSDLCESDNRKCSNIKTDSRGEWVGTCSSTGKECVAATIGEFATYAMKNYGNMESKYNCSTP